MFVRDVMTMNVVTIPGHTSIADAKRIRSGKACRHGYRTQVRGIYAH